MEEMVDLQVSSREEYLRAYSMIVDKMPTPTILNFGGVRIVVDVKRNVVNMKRIVSVQEILKLSRSLPETSVTLM
jgi:hypothetical protein